jgi:hypothetical protein
VLRTLREQNYLTGPHRVRPNNQRRLTMVAETAWRRILNHYITKHTDQFDDSMKRVPFKSDSSIVVINNNVNNRTMRFNI